MMRIMKVQDARTKKENQIMSGKFKRILYGGDYNPNQWPKEIWKEDMAYFKDARINSATINVFSWARLQPSEEVYDFSQLDEIVDMLSREGYDIIMATSTMADTTNSDSATMPAPIPWCIRNMQGRWQENWPGVMETILISSAGM